ncbi:MAG: adenylate/guanylate cyclase domain-containing protein [Flavobacteriales bacterium]|jgi:adenylate cyclase
MHNGIGGQRGTTSTAMAITQTTTVKPCEYRGTQCWPAFALVLMLVAVFSCSAPLQAQWNQATWEVTKSDPAARRAIVDSTTAYLEKNYLYSKPDSGLIISEQILDAGLVTGDSLMQMKGLFWKGAFWHQKGTFDSAEVYLRQVLPLAMALHDTTYLADAYKVLGFLQEGRGDVKGALDYYFRIVPLLEAQHPHDALRLGGSYLNIAFLYQSIGLAELAGGYFNKYVQTVPKTPRVEQNTNGFKGDLAALQNKPAEAVSWYEKGIAYAKKSGNKLDLVTFYCYAGEQEMKRGNGNGAKTDFLEGVAIAKKLGNEEWWARMKTSLGELAVREGHYQEGYAESSAALLVADRIGDRRTQHDACKTLYAASRALGRPAEALAFNDRVVALEMSMRVDELTNTTLRREFEVKLATDSLEKEKALLEERMEHQQEVATKDKARNILIAGGIFLLMAAGGLYSRMRYMQRAKRRVEKEKKRSDDLLLNILPAEIAEELKLNGEAPARDFELVSILFTDFKDFTQTSEKLDATHLVAEINTCFKAFDAIMGKYGIEKIKTIGDAYMCAGGLPLPSADSTVNTVRAALDMQAFMKTRKQELDAQGLPAFEMRCGIHTGPVVAGIVGVKKFQYDIWGDTVNTASRMESSGEVGQVNISAATYALVKNEPELSFASRGKVLAKGKGEMEMYFVGHGQGAR